MNVCNTIFVAEIAASNELAGATNGAAWFVAAREKLDAVPPGLHVINFQGIKLATVSWLREAVLALRNTQARCDPTLSLLLPTSPRLFAKNLRLG